MVSMVMPDALEARIESGGVTSSIWANTLAFKTSRSGTLSWTKSAFDTASFISAVKVSRSRLAPEARPMSVSSFHASSTPFRKLASASGAGSVAITSKPLARYCAAQLAPIKPVPTIATFRICVSAMSFSMRNRVSSKLLVARNCRFDDYVLLLASQVERVGASNSDDILGFDRMQVNEEGQLVCQVAPADELFFAYSSHRPKEKSKLHGNSN